MKTIVEIEWTKKINPILIERLLFEHFVKTVPFCDNSITVRELPVPPEQGLEKLANDVFKRFWPPGPDVHEICKVCRVVQYICDFIRNWQPIPATLPKLEREKFDELTELRHLKRLIREYSENTPCSCSHGIQCWRCVFLYNLAMMRCKQLEQPIPARVDTRPNCGDANQRAFISEWVCKCAGESTSPVLAIVCDGFERNPYQYNYCCNCGHHKSCHVQDK